MHHIFDSESEEKEGTIEDWPRFKIDQKIVIDHVEFYIKEIRKKDMILRPTRARFKS